MKLIFTRLMVAMAALGFSTTAFAGFHMEPYVGANITGDYEFSGLGGTSGDYSRTNFGIKLGYQAPVGIQIGGDIQLGTGSYDASAGGGDADSANAEFGAYLGYQSMMGLRGYVGYMFSSAVIVDQVPSDDTYTGNGFKLGVGYSFMAMNVPWFAVNLEYHMMSYDEVETNSVSSTVDFTNNAIMIVASFPFNFGG